MSFPKLLSHATVFVIAESFLCTPERPAFFTSGAAHLSATTRLLTFSTWIRIHLARTRASSRAAAPPLCSKTPPGMHVPRLPPPRPANSGCICADVLLQSRPFDCLTPLTPLLGSRAPARPLAPDPAPPSQCRGACARPERCPRPEHPGACWQAGRACSSPACAGQGLSKKTDCLSVAPPLYGTSLRSSQPVAHLRARLWSPGCGLRGVGARRTPLPAGERAALRVALPRPGAVRRPPPKKLRVCAPRR